MQKLTPATTDVTDGLFFPEGPLWCDDGSVLVTELGGECVTRVQPDGTNTKVSDNGGSPNGLAIGPDGALYVCNSGGWDFHELGGLRVPPALKASLFVISGRLYTNATRPSGR